MNATKVKLYKQFLKGISNKNGGAEEYINKAIEKICFHEKIIFTRENLFC